MSFRRVPGETTLSVVQVVRSARVSPHMIRVTVGGEQLDPLRHQGFDHWFRLFLPQEEGETSFDLPARVDVRGYLQFLRMRSDTRPHLRNYTVRDFRPEQRELDIDFVVHGDEGIATRWAQRVAPGATVALLDQGTAYEYDEATAFHLLVGDVTALPAIAGILRDLPRDARGLAIVEVPDAADAQPCSEPPGVEVRWIVSEHGARPGAASLAALEAWRPEAGLDPGTVSAYLVGEQRLATGARRHVVAQGVPKARVTFAGYWRLPKGA